MSARRYTEGMTSVAFSGPTDPGLNGLLLVRDVLARVAIDSDCYVSGAAYGIDTYAAFYAHTWAPSAALHTLCVPRGKRHNERLVRWAQRVGFQIIEVDGGYMRRNDEMIRRADHLIAFPPTRVAPSNPRGGVAAGTWATIRRARRKGIPIDIYPIDEWEATR